MWVGELQGSCVTRDGHEELGCPYTGPALQALTLQSYSKVDLD